MGWRSNPRRPHRRRRVTNGKHFLAEPAVESGFLQNRERRRIEKACASVCLASRMNRDRTELLNR